MKNVKVLVEVSARHAHLSQESIDRLFGKDYKLKKLKQLSQPCEFACKETLEIEANGREIKNVRIVGPAGKRSQVEISKTDARFLRIEPSLKTNASKKDVKIVVKNKGKSIMLPVIIKQRHLHCSEKEARQFGLKNDEKIKIKIPGKRALIFDNVVVRIGKCYKLAVHLDTDEGNAAGINEKAFGKLIRG